MESIQFLRSEIKKFADPLYWLTYFPPIPIVGISPIYSILFFIPTIQKNDHNGFGFRIDWRRNFLTTKANPYFCLMAGEQVIQTRQNQVYRAIHYLQSKR